MVCTAERCGKNSLVDLALAMVALRAAVKTDGVNWNVCHLFGRDLHLREKAGKGIEKMATRRLSDSRSSPVQGDGRQTSRG